MKGDDHSWSRFPLRLVVAMLLVTSLWTVTRIAPGYRKLPSNLSYCVSPAKSEESENGWNQNIPHRLAFNYYKNLWSNNNNNVTSFADNEEELKLAQNVRHSVKLFLQAWNDSIPVSVAFRDDEDCERLVKASAPSLLEHFRKEAGMFKSDICRIVDLQQYGGYYLDNDLAVLEAPLLPKHVTFATVLEAGLNGFFQSFLAVTPHHPVMTEAIRVMTEHYEGTLGIDMINMGTWTLKMAYDRVVARDPSIGTQAWILQEFNLQDHKKLFPQVPRDTTWKHYNFAVMDVPMNKVYFYSRLGTDFRKRNGIV